MPQRNTATTRPNTPATRPVPFIPTLMAVAFATLLAGCQALPSHDDGAPKMADASAAKDDTADTPAVVSTWTADTLADLLTGEVAGQRGDLKVALDAYLRQAEATRNPELAERATRIAWYAHDDSAARRASSLWVELAPGNPEAMANALMGLIQNGEFDAASPLLDRLLTDEKHPVRFDYLVQYAHETDPDSRKRMAQLLADMSVKHPRIARLWLARGAVAEMNGDLADSLVLVRKAIELDASNPAALELEGRLLIDTGNSGEARKKLKGPVKRYPRERELRLTYLKALLDDNRGDEARRELADMLKVWPNDGDLSLSLALVEWETGAADAARTRMVALAGTGYREDEAWSYAGRIAASQRRYDLAATYFQNVRGRDFLAAQIQVAYCWQRLGRLADARNLIKSLREQAPESMTMMDVAESEILWRAKDGPGSFALLDAALVMRPDDRDLRYARAMAAERLDKLDVVESDLNQLLDAAPDNAMLLNALGYTLADKTTRLADAKALIDRAISISPDDPAIIDSMGWVNYRLGNLPEAERWLRRAHKLSPDGEISAHLGEVLWAAGKHREARSVWSRAKARDPDNDLLMQTIRKFDP